MLDQITRPARVIEQLKSTYKIPEVNGVVRLIEIRRRGESNETSPRMPWDIVYRTGVYGIRDRMHMPRLHIQKAVCGENLQAHPKSIRMILFFL